MSTTMTTAVPSLGAGALSSTGESEAHPLSNYWKALVPIVAGVALLIVADSRRADAERVVLLRAICGGDHRLDSRADSRSGSGT